MSTAPVQITLATEPMELIATSRTHSADDAATYRPEFETAFLERAKGLMLPSGVGDLPSGVPEFLLRKRVSDDTYDLENTQDLYIGWCMAVESGAAGLAATAYRAQLENQLQVAKYELAALKVKVQNTDPKFRRKVLLTRFLAFLERLQARFK